MPVPLRSRVIEVIADLGEGAAPRYKYGSGCIVRGRSVLTAAHVVSGARAVRVRRPDKRLLDAVVNSRFIVAEPGPDLALVEIDDYRIDLEPIELAVIDRDSLNAAPVRDCHAIGYPWFAETPSPTAVRETVDAVGYVPVLSGLAKGMLTVQVTDSPQPLPPAGSSLRQSQWAGMSGAPVVASGCLLGVVNEHAPRQGQSAITAVPLSAIEPNDAEPGWGSGVPNPVEWWVRLGVAGEASVRRLPEDSDSDGRTGTTVILTDAERRQLLTALSDVFHTRVRIDSVLDDLGFAPGRRPLTEGTIEDVWRAVFRELDAGRLPDGYRSLIQRALERYGHNPTFKAFAVRYGITA
ncbi:MAG TPA: effector-associated domain EAD1-containing protein [Streptosporangiaceae bacterium]|nr:effector-associated domain EAD1-containing protein [Streptosporangiaceae bacterium]